MRRPGALGVIVVLLAGACSNPAAPGGVAEVRFTGAYRFEMVLSRSCASPVRSVGWDLVGTSADGMSVLALPGGDPAVSIEARPSSGGAVFLIAVSAPWGAYDVWFLNVLIGAPVSRAGARDEVRSAALSGTVVLTRQDGTEEVRCSAADHQWSLSAR